MTKSVVTADLVTFNEEILNEKLHFLCCVTCYGQNNVVQDLYEVSHYSYKYASLGRYIHKYLETGKSAHL